MGYNTKIDWRNVDYLKIYVDAYQVDGEIEDMAAPASVVSMPEPVQTYEAKATPIARGLGGLPAAPWLSNSAIT